MTLNSSSKKLTQQLGDALPQAVLLVGEAHTHALDVARQVAMHASCVSPNKPCHTCQSCRLIADATHPDITLITPEKIGSAIKVDQIRGLQHSIYQTPQCAKKRIIMIYPANEMNRSAANALLKMLEEPPKHVCFILIATHTNTLPQTIMSRTQTYLVPEPKLPSHAHIPGYLALGLHFDDTTPRGLLFKQHADLIQNLLKLTQHQYATCKLAADCEKHALTDCLWFFHLLTTTLIQIQLTPELFSEFNPNIQALAEQHTSAHYFKQLDMILTFTKKINLDIPLNPILTLEALFIGYL